MTSGSSSIHRRPRFFRRSIFIVNFIAAVALLAAQSASFVSPAKFWPLEVLALSYPLLLVLNSGFLIFWVLLKHRNAFLSAAIILIGYDKPGQLYQPGFLPVDVMAPAGSVKVMSYNVRLFDLYNWTGNMKTRSNIFKLLKQEHPDILCLQEYFHADKGDFRNNEAIKKLLSHPYATIRYGLTLRKEHHWGLATFSRYPVVNEGMLLHRKGSTNFGIFSDIVVKEDTVRVYNVHLQSNHFGKNDYATLEMTDSTSREEALKGTKSILKRIRSAVRLRSQQVDELKLHMSSSPYPVILCGDFNDPSFTYAYQTLKKDLRDAYTEKGDGLGITYANGLIRLRIDFILHSPIIQTFSFQTLSDKLSDHQPIVAKMRLP